MTTADSASGFPPPPDRVELVPAPGIGEVTDGTDLTALVAAVPDLADGDVVLLTSKVVSKAEGRVVAGDRDAVVAQETVRPVARRGRTAIVENHLGLVMAAAGVDASNVEPGRLVLLPLDPDRTARSIREGVLERTGRNVAVLVTDTAGRAWRHGQTDIAIGAAGIDPVFSLAGVRDAHGNELAVTAPAVADELAAAADLVAGKVGGRPLVVARGLAGLVHAPGRHGPGARALLRGRGEDMFGLGSREAVLAAVRQHGAEDFGAPASRDELAEALSACGCATGPTSDDEVVEVSAAGADEAESVAVRLALARVVAFAHGWEPAGDTRGDVGGPSAGGLSLRRRSS
ncbi:MAG TPA: coenzyme F420-0:L-glutamate ligase [Marmoricola sp.]